MLLVETTNLTKRYGRRAVVDHVGLQVGRGEVYGFLSPNGAGKTTTLRLLLGLVRPSSGAARVLGAAPGAPAALARIGMLVEAPAFYPYVSGRDNLRVFARYASVPAAKVDEVLETVDLADRAQDRASSHSLGMKQRLGVAAALLKDPALLILDEPTNALEPAGMAKSGFETVTYMIDGIFRHQDSNGGGGLITDGDTQWMTAGGVLPITHQA